MSSKQRSLEAWLNDPGRGRVRQLAADLLGTLHLGVVLKPEFSAGDAV